MPARRFASGSSRSLVPPGGEPGVKTYEFEVELETDEDGWHVFYPPWSSIGASTWGYTRKEALENIQEVLSMIIEEFIEEGKAGEHREGRWFGPRSVGPLCPCERH